MFEALTRDLGRLAVFMICAQMIVCFRPRESYEKYLRLLMSALILLQFLTPVKRILTGEALDSKILENYAEILEMPFGEARDKSMQDGGNGMGEGCGFEVKVEAVPEIKMREINCGGVNEP